MSVSNKVAAGREVGRRARQRLQAWLRHRGWSPEGLSREDVVWCYRILLDRDPENDTVIRARLEVFTSLRDLRRDILQSPEYQAANSDNAFAEMDNVVIAEIPNEGRLFVSLSDDAVGLNIIRGVYEPEIAAYFCSLLQPGMTVVDVGANIGFFTLMAANRVGPTGRVVAFEPLAENGAALVRMVEENSLRSIVQVEQQALSDRAGESILTMGRFAHSSGGAYLAPTADVQPGFLTQPTPVATLDSFPEVRDVSVIKIDVEGAEPLVFRGGRSILQTARPIVICELHHRQLQLVAGIGVDDLIAELHAFGYACHSIDGGTIGRRVRRASRERPETVAFLPQS
jgi:FkbM family methyltransferase